LTGVASRLDLAPEGVDRDVKQVGDLLEGLVGFLGQDLRAASARNSPWRGERLRASARSSAAPSGQDALISVPFTAPSLPGSCRVDFKMTDRNGRLYCPYEGGVYVIVNVTG
jgi:hypothetical protein